ncbi:MAG: hypothetical protein EOO52_07510 [Gammaproteobacteria bacterium]|nr:MAG: hypothetical protein EOO52_07510 [Gammaproteobacteria bacterium]
MFKKICLMTSMLAYVNTYAAETTEIQTNIDVEIDSERSLFVHDLATLNGANFSLSRVFAQLADQFNRANPSSPIDNVQLFARFWDTQNPAPGFVEGGPKCTGVLNEFPLECRIQEGLQAQTPEEFLGSYIPLALINRFDLRDKNSFTDCGESRIIFGLTNNPGRNFIIFEAQMPNPTPGLAAGCVPIVNFWKNLSAESDASVRASLLDAFYFNGLPEDNVRPVIDIRNYAPKTGQIRTNQFMGFTWVLKEFKTTVERGQSIIKPAPVKANPFGEFFNNGRLAGIAVDFRNQFLNYMGSLLIEDISTFSLTIQSDGHNNGQSHASGLELEENDFMSHLDQGINQDFRNAIQIRSGQLGSSLSTNQIVNRATAMTCGGCHQPSAFGLTNSDSVGDGQTWPETLGFTHVSEFASDGVFPISPALQEVFLPARKVDMESFIINPSNLSISFSTMSNVKLKNTQKSNSKTAKPILIGKRSG